MKCDTWCGLKTHQRGRALQIYLPFSSFLFLLAFLSVTQYLPGAVYSGPLFHSSVALASASPGVFTLYFLSPPLPLRTVGYSLRILSFFVSFFFHFCLLNYPPHFCSDDALSLLFFPSLPSSLNSLSCWPSLWLLFPVLHCFSRVSSSISAGPRSLLGMVSCHLCRMTWVAGETPPV